MSRRRLWARRLGIAAGVAFIATAVWVGVRGKTEEPRARVPAATVLADSGPAGVVWVRDGAVVRIDRQSPPDRLVIPAPRRAPWPDGVAVGRRRMWVSSQGLVRGYSQGGRSVRAFRVTPTNPLLMAEAGGLFWAITPNTGQLYVGQLSDRPMRFGEIGLPCPARDLEALGSDAWVLCDAPGGRSALVRVTSPALVTTVATFPARPRALSAWTRSVWVLDDRALHRVDAGTGRVEGPYGVTPDASEVAAGPGRGLVLDPRTGIVLDRTLGGSVYTYNLGPGARAITATAPGFWVSTGDAATPRRVDYAQP